MPRFTCIAPLVVIATFCVQTMAADSTSQADSLIEAAKKATVPKSPGQCVMNTASTGRMSMVKLICVLVGVGSTYPRTRVGTSVCLRWRVAPS